MYNAQQSGEDTLSEGPFVTEMLTVCKLVEGKDPFILSPPIVYICTTYAPVPAHNAQGKIAQS